MKIWNTYVARINKDFNGRDLGIGIAYWQNRLFIHLITFFLPCSTVCIAIGIYMCLHSQLRALAVIEFAAFVCLCYSAFARTLNIGIRKTVFLAVVHLVAFVLLYYLGSMGPGMLYLLAGTLFAVLVTAPGYAWWSTAIIGVVCIWFAFAFHLNFIHTPISKQYTLASWITVSSNVLILSATTVLLVPKLFSKLEAANIRYVTIAKATSDTIYEWNLGKGRVVYNAGITEVFGYSAEEINATSDWWIDHIHPDDRLRVTQRFADILANVELVNVQLEHRFRASNGSYKNVYNRASVIRDKEGKAVSLVGAVHDITALKNYIEAIEKQNKRLNDISWIQSHKVRSPVATILGLIPLLDNTHAIEHNAIILEGVRQSCMQLDAVIKEITDLSNPVKV